MAFNGESVQLKKSASGDQTWDTFISLFTKRFQGLKLRIPETLVFGWTSKTPMLYFTDESTGLCGKMNITPGFMATFLSEFPSHNRTPLCVGRQTSTFLLCDSKEIMTLWHKNLAINKPVFIQKYISQSGEASSLIRIIWKPESLSYVTLTNVVPFNGVIRRRSMVILRKSRADPEDIFLTRAGQASKSSEISNNDELEEFAKTLAEVFVQYFTEQHLILAEFEAEFIQSLEGKWFLTRIPSFTVAKLAVSLPALSPLMLKSRSLKANNRYKHLSIKRLSQTILSIKQSLGITITTNDRERLANHTDFAKKLRPRASLPQPRKKDEEAKYTVVEPKPDQSLDMPPLFQFPTPRDNEEALNPIDPETRLSDIKDFIAKQNNSMFTRIHYQEELPEVRRLKEYVTHSVSSVAAEFDKVRKQGSQGRDLLKAHQNTIYRHYV